MLFNKECKGCKTYEVEKIDNLVVKVSHPVCVFAISPVYFRKDTPEEALLTFLKSRNGPVKLLQAWPKQLLSSMWETGLRSNYRRMS